MKKIFKRILNLLVLLFLLYFIVTLFVSPFKIERGSVNVYREGQVVFGISKYILFRSPLNAGDIIVFKLPETFGNNGIGEVIGGAGDAGYDGYYFSGEPIGDTIPYGFYLVKYSNRFVAVAENQITYKIWYPLRNIKELEKRNYK